MEDQKVHERKELLEQIMAKRQQIEFEKIRMAEDIAVSQDNNQNPDVSEEMKNFYDPAGNVIDRGEIKDLSEAEEDLIRLIDRLHKLDKGD